MRRLPTDPPVGTEMSGSNPSSPRAQQKLGKYTLIKKLGAGGMAEAFLAQFTGAAGFLKTCVIKRMLPHLAQDEQYVKMFHAEAKVAALLTHTNVVQIFDLGEISGTHFIAMELVDGAPLHLLARTAWRRQRSVPLEVVCCAMADAALGLAAAHELADEDGKPLGVIHRDISPDNLMMNREGVTKVLDFGVAKQIGNEQTAAGELRGKLLFLAPEQLLGKKLDRRADLYALGVTFYWLVTGKRPFTAENEHALMHMIVKTECPPPIALNPAVPDRINDLIVQLMAKDPAKRPDDAFAVHDLLADVLVARRTLVVPFVREMLSGELAPNDDIAFHTPAFVPSTPHTQALKDAWSNKAPAKEPPWNANANANANAHAQPGRPQLSASTDLDDPTVAAPYNVGDELPGRVDLDSLQEVPPTEVLATQGRSELSMADASPSDSIGGMQPQSPEPDFMEKTVAVTLTEMGIGIGDENVIRPGEQTHAVEPFDPKTMPALDEPITAPSPRPDITSMYPPEDQAAHAETSPNVNAEFDPFADMSEILPPTPALVRTQPALSDVLNSDAARALDGPRTKKSREKLPVLPIAAGVGILAMCALLWLISQTDGGKEAPLPTPDDVVALPADAASENRSGSGANKIPTATNRLPLEGTEKLEVPAVDAQKLEELRRRAEEDKRAEAKRADERREQRRAPPREERRKEAKIDVAAKAPGGIQWQLNGKNIGKGNTTLSLPADTKSVTAVDNKRGGRSVVPVVNGVADYGALPRGKIHPRASPFADVYLGSEALGTTPFPAVEVVTGKYQLRFVHEGKEETRSVDVNGGQTAKVAVDFGG